MVPLLLLLSTTVAVDKTDLFNRAVNAAREERLHEEPAVKREIDLVLYKAFLDKRLAAAGDSLAPTEAEVKAEYEKKPLVRLRHLALPSSKRRLAQTIARETGKGADFRKTVLRYSPDERAGDLDFRGVNGLPPEFYAAALKLRPGKVAPVLTTKDAVHVIQLIAIKPVTEAYPVYLEFLRGELRAAREKAFLSSVLSELKRSSSE